MALSRKSRLAVVSLLTTGILLLLAVGWAVQWFRPSPPIRVSPETTYITKPIGTSGLPDLYQERMRRNGHGIPADENGAVALVEAIGKSDESPTSWAALTDALSMPADTPIGHLGNQEQRIADRLRTSTTDPRAALGEEPIEPPEWNWDDPFLKAVTQIGTHPWRVEECPQAADVIEQDDQAYVRLRDAVARPGFYIPPMFPINSSEEANFASYFVTGLRESIRSLTRRAMLRLGQRDFHAAWDDVRLAYEIADRVPSDTGVMLLVQVACDGQADLPLNQLLADPDLPESLAREILDWHRSLRSPWDRVRTASTGERLYAIDSTLHLRSNPAARADLEEGAILFGDFRSRRLVNGSLDWNVVLRETNELFDAADRIAATDDWPTRRRQLHAFDQQCGAKLTRVASGSRRGLALFHPRLRSELVADELAAWHQGATSMVFEIIDREVAERRLREIASALALHRARSGEYPSSLDPLVPELFPELPVDPMHGKPIRYERIAANEILLYSVGANGVDEQGSRADVLQVFRGLRMDEEALREQPHRDTVAKELQRSGAEIDPAILGTHDFDPHSLLPQDADDISWRTPPPCQSLAKRLANAIEQRQ